MTTTTNRIPPRIVGESLEDWQQRAMESADAWTLCLAVTARGTLCARLAQSCRNHTPPR